MEVEDSQCLIMDTVRRSCCLLALRPPSLQAAAAVEELLPSNNQCSTCRSTAIQT